VGKNLALFALKLFPVSSSCLMGPASAPVWLAGLWAASVRPRRAAYRIFPHRLFSALLCVHRLGMAKPITSVRYIRVFLPSALRLARD